ncbi:MAG TPA: N-acetyltransferase [Phenylobacterium sp.]|jgi:putative acetyltransferase|uniref:GNAT family N-acetyltransferase n=1 Tax=Phenylobacterium sp. TaxID=1871053 RepID=UPI002D645637|nr:N-acetyltransferase [Phenylobacterium sp.]HZZ67308.1 N-acetyltransferase [Phenylobacterium sp.]
MQIRAERPEDANAIHFLTEAAFKEAPHASHTEAKIVDALRTADALTVSLVAIEDSAVVGHVAFSPVTISSGARNWFGLGPVSVTPARQGQGIGQALVREGLRRLEDLGAAGCVVLGDPDYYGRFGFAYDPGLTYGDIPPGYFQRLTLNGASPKGEVAYHPGFDAS